MPRDAIVLAGGRARRLDGAAKPLLRVGGQTLLASAVDAAAAAGSGRIVVVGPESPVARPVVWCREDPPFAGPVAGLVAGLGEVEADWTLVLAADVPLAGAAVAALVRVAPGGDGTILVDAAGRRQWLVGLYRTEALRARASELPDGGRDQPLRALLGGLSLSTVADPDGLSADVDTWEDLERARRRSGAGEDAR